MLHKALSTAGMLALAGATVLWTAGPSQAAPHGGHFGGGHFGGAHFGGAHFGGYRGGFYHGGFGHVYGYRPYSGYHNSYRGYSYPYYGYYAYPYYGTYNSYPYSANYNYYSDLSPSVST